MDNEEPLRSETHTAEKPQKALLEPVYPWKKAWQTLKVIWPQLVYISLVCMSIPQYLLFIFSTEKAHVLSQPFKINQVISLENAMGVLRDFAVAFISVGWIVGVLFLVGVFTAIALCAQVARSEAVSLPAAVKSGVRVLFPKGLFFLILVAVGALLFLNISIQLFPGQIIKFIGLIFGVLISALPALMLIHPKKPFQAFRAAVRMEYVSFTAMSKWSVFFLLLTYQLIALNLIALIEWIGASLLTLDIPLRISRDQLFVTSEAWPFGKAIYFVEVFYSVGISFVALAFVVWNSTFILELYRRHTLGRTISVVI
ncbi:MAG: hypothetical protein EOP10_21530 [Proteobacteria bacterium]|nr:MAG: hypothetical protein EOP10_21530 [Pseudomonadota bacterium]